MRLAEWFGQDVVRSKEEEQENAAANRATAIRIAWQLSTQLHESHYALTITGFTILVNIHAMGVAEHGSHHDTSPSWITMTSVIHYKHVSCEMTLPVSWSLHSVTLRSPTRVDFPCDQT